MAKNDMMEVGVQFEESVAHQLQKAYNALMKAQSDAKEMIAAYTEATGRKPDVAEDMKSLDEIIVKLQGFELAGGIQDFSGQHNA